MSLIILIFVDIVDIKGYESLATKANICVETFDIATYYEGPILRVDVETQTTIMVNLVDEQCGAVGLSLQVDVTINTIGLIPTIAVATSMEVTILCCKIDIAFHIQDLQTECLFFPSVQS